MKHYRKFLALLMTLIMALSVAVPASAANDLLILAPGAVTDSDAVSDEAAAQVSFSIGGLENNLWVNKHGNLYCDCSAAAFTAAGFTWGDVVTVTLLGQELQLPVVSTFSYVDSGSPAVIMGKDETGAATGYLAFVINMGNFTDTYGVATKQTDADGNWWWTAKEGVTFPVTGTIEMAEQGGYLAEYLLRDLTRTNAREDYANLSDEEFANFRSVATTGMGEGALYRSSSPINPELNRSTYADAALKAAGVKTIINLANNEMDAAVYEGFASTYYAGQNVAYLCLGADFQVAEFQTGLANGLRYMAANEGPYLVHCNEGKDRAGFVVAVLACYMGATYDEVIADYMRTYYNYYGVEVGSEKYDAIAQSNIVKSLKKAFQIEDLTTADLQASAEAYFKACGLTDAELAALTANLKRDYAASEQETYTVAKGDSLWKIAKIVYGKGAMWNVIYEANTDIISDASCIYVGQTLVIPAA